MNLFFSYNSGLNNLNPRKKKRSRVVCENFLKNQEKKILQLKEKKKITLNKKILLRNQSNSFFLLRKLESITKIIEISSFFNYYFPIELEEEIPSYKCFLLLLSINIEQDSFFGFQFLILILVDCFNFLPSIRKLEINEKFKLKENSIFKCNYQFEKSRGGAIIGLKTCPNSTKKNFFFVKNFYYEKSFFPSISNFEYIQNSYMKYLLISEKKKILEFRLFSKKNLFFIYSNLLFPSCIKNNWGGKYIIHERWCKTTFRSFFFTVNKRKKTRRETFFLKKKRFILIPSFFKSYFSSNYYLIQFGKDSYRSLFFTDFNLSPVKILILMDDNITKWDNLFQSLEKKKKHVRIIYLSLKIDSDFDYLQKLVASLKKKNFRCIFFLGSLKNFSFSQIIATLYLIPALQLSKVFSGVKNSIANGKKKVFFLIRPKKFLVYGFITPFEFTNKPSLFLKNRKLISNEIDFFFLNSPLSHILFEPLNLEFSNINFMGNFILFINENNLQKHSHSKNPYFFFSIIIISRWLANILHGEIFSESKKQSLLNFIVLIISIIENRYNIKDILRIKGRIC